MLGVQILILILQILNNQLFSLSFRKFRNSIIETVSACLHNYYQTCRPFPKLYSLNRLSPYHQKSYEHNENQRKFITKIKLRISFY